MKNTKIKWADYTVNPWTRSTQILYATLHKINAEAALAEKKPRVLCAPKVDVFANEVPDSLRMDLFQWMAETPNLQWLVLTNFVGNVRPYTKIDGLAFDLIGDGRVWLGATICNEEEFERDALKLLKTPAAKRFLSMEPLLGSVDISDGLRDEIACRKGFEQNCNGEIGYCKNCHGHKDDPIHTMHAGKGIDWVIVGGQSGFYAPPMKPDWVRSLRDQCVAARVPFFFNQWDGWALDKILARGEPGGDLRRAGEKTVARLLDGREWNEVPE